MSLGEWNNEAVSGTAESLTTFRWERPKKIMEKSFD